MKKVFVTITVILLIAIFIVPIPLHLKDGGTVKYQAVLYSISDVHRLASTEDDVAYEDGIIVEVLGFEVYNNVKKAPAQEEPETDTPPAEEPSVDTHLTVGDFELSYASVPVSNKIHRDALNSEKLADSSARHLPIYKLDDPEALESFKADFADELTMDSGYDEVPSFNEVTKKYTGGFFEDNCVFLIYVDATNSTHRYALDGINIDGEYCCIHIKETTGAEAVDDSLAGWFVTVAVTRDSVPECTELDAVLNHGFDDIVPTVPVLREAPDLYVTVDEISIEAMKGTLDWTYKEEDGKAVTLNADSSHPLSLKEHMPCIALVPTVTAYTYPIRAAHLQFGASPNKFSPDSISVRRWTAESWGDPEAESTSVTVDNENGNIYIPLENGDCIYEISAEWNESRAACGTVRYSFYTIKASADAVLDYEIVGG